MSFSTRKVSSSQKMTLKSAKKMSGLPISNYNLQASKFKIKLLMKFNLRAKAKTKPLMSRHMMSQINLVKWF